MLRFGTMGRRIFLVIFATTLCTILVFGSMTVLTMQEYARKNDQAQLETMLLQLKANIEQDYQALLQLSQHMMPYGAVGRIMTDYLQADTAYDEGAAKRALSKALSTYGGLTTQLVIYYSQADQRTVFSNLMPDDAFFSAQRADTLYENYMIEYQAMHPSHSKHSAKLVTSLRRHADFEDGSRYSIYVERTSNVPDILQKTSEVQNIPYILLQLDEQGIVRYSSDTASFPLLSSPVLDDTGFGEYNAFMYVSSPFAFGPDCVLLVPLEAYNHTISSWMRRAAVAVVIIIAVILLAARLLYRYVFQGLNVFKEEIDKTIHGDLESTARHTGIDELDQLLIHFDRMKQQIKHTMAERAMQERARRHRELEQLTYQINPHFLLNTLNSLHWLSAMNKQTEISDYVSKLSTILSYNLGRLKQPPSLRSELRILASYLDIEQMRHDFSVRWDVEEGDYLDMLTPRLILQPIVENAIGHGMDEGGRLSLTVRPDREQGLVFIDIEDDGCGIDPRTLELLTQPQGKKGVGLSYVRIVIEEQYADRARLSISNRPEGGTRVTLILPLETQGDKP